MDGKRIGTEAGPHVTMQMYHTCHTCPYDHHSCQIGKVMDANAFLCDGDTLLRDRSLLEYRRASINVPSAKLSSRVAIFGFGHEVFPLQSKKLKLVFKPSYKEKCRSAAPTRRPHAFREQCAIGLGQHAVQVHCG